MIGFTADYFFGYSIFFGCSIATCSIFSFFSSLGCWTSVLGFNGSDIFLACYCLAALAASTFLLNSSMDFWGTFL
jgi:hypothetical protein